MFLRALIDDCVRRGLRVENNSISATTRACLFNSFNFDPTRLDRLRRPHCRMVHRVDGPVGEYRGRDDGSDARVAEVNERFADATIFQSQYSLDAHRRLGFECRAPTVIHNAPDALIFHARGRAGPPRGRRVRLIATSWSDNPLKGAAVYEWLERHLDWSRFEFTFVGRTAGRFTRTRHLAPMGSSELANELRSHDIYMTASRNDPCSNALLEALACGLPAIFLRSGGHPELVGPGGLGFEHAEEIPDLLDRLAGAYEQYQSAIRVPTLAEVVNRYLAVLGVDVDGRRG